MTHKKQSPEIAWAHEFYTWLMSLGGEHKLVSVAVVTAYMTLVACARSARQCKELLNSVGDTWRFPVNVRKEILEWWVKMPKQGNATNATPMTTATILAIADTQRRTIAYALENAEYGPFDEENVLPAVEYAGSNLCELYARAVHADREIVRAPQEDTKPGNPLVYLAPQPEKRDGAMYASTWEPVNETPMSRQLSLFGVACDMKLWYDIDQKQLWAIVSASGLFLTEHFMHSMRTVPLQAKSVGSNTGLSINLAFPVGAFDPTAYITGDLQEVQNMCRDGIWPTTYYRYYIVEAGNVRQLYHDVVATLQALGVPVVITR